MIEPFEYDVFISFSSADEAIAKPIWQELCSNGLRVFWSDATLKKEVGNSWFEVIEKSLERSKHMLLVCSENSMNSKWVKREYRAFFDYCYSPNSRRLVPLLANGFPPGSIPIFLRELQVGRIDDPQFIHEIIPLLGGVNIEKLQQENLSLKEQIYQLSDQILSLRESRANHEKLRLENQSLQEKMASILDRNALLEKIKTDLEKSQHENQLLREQADSLSMMIALLKGRVTDFDKTREENRSLKEQTGTLLDQVKVLEARSRDLEKLQSDFKRLQEQTVALTGKAAPPKEKRNRFRRQPPQKQPGHQPVNPFKSGNPVKVTDQEQEQKPGTVLSVANLHPYTSDNDLRNFFSPAGQVRMTKVNRAYGGSASTTGIVEMSTLEEAARAIDLLDGKELRKQAITIAYFAGPDGK